MLRHGLRLALVDHSQGERFYAYSLFYLLLRFLVPR